MLFIFFSLLNIVFSVLFIFLLIKNKGMFFLLHVIAYYLIFSSMVLMVCSWEEIGL